MNVSDKVNNGRWPLGGRAAGKVAVAALMLSALGGCGSGSNNPPPGTGTTQGMQNVSGGASAQSTNWSGYGVTGGPLGFNQISASWRVPGSSCSGSDSTESASWAGIGGLVSTDQTLIQAGTEQDCNGGKASYYAWWEGFPAPSEDVSSSGSFPVQAGDVVTVTIDSTALLLWTITIHDATAGWTFNTTTPFVAVGESAEWIEEAPLNVGTSGTALATLTNYGRISFSALSANGANPALTEADSIEMVNSSNAVISTPSAPGSGGDAFDVCFGSGSCD
jgi:hypothetical protein